MKTAYKFRLYPTKQQEAVLDLTLETCRHLWNDALADRKNAWEQDGITRTYNQRQNSLELKRRLVAMLASILRFSRTFSDG